MTLQASKKAVLGIDVGGTKIATCLYPVENGHILDQPITHRYEEKTLRGIQNHTGQMVELVEDAAIDAQLQGYQLVAVGVGSPGKFIQQEDGSFTIDPGTNPNLGKTPDEFDHANLPQLYRDALDAKPSLNGLPIYVVNDAVAAHMSLMHQTLDSDDVINKGLLKGKTVGYVGPGTGAGGSFARVDDKGKITLITDGHICDMLVDMTDPALKLEEIGYSADKLKAISAALPKNEGLEFEGDSIRAESVISGTGMARILGLKEAKEISLDNPDHVNGLKLMGKVMAGMIRDIRNQDVHKLERVRKWTEEEQALASKTSTYYFSGGLGASDAGSVVLDEARKTLKEMGVDGISFIQQCGKNAVRTAADAVPAELLARSQGRVNEH